MALFSAVHINPVGFWRCWLLPGWVLLCSAFPKLASVLSLGYLPCMASVPQFETDWNSFVWNKVPIITLSPHPWWEAAGCWGEKCLPGCYQPPPSLVAGSSFWQPLTRALERPETVERRKSPSWNSGLLLAISKTQKISFLSFLFCFVF